MITARVLADSIAPCGKRLTTWEATYPRPIHSEVLTHKMLSRNSASSRAIPTEKLIQRVIDDPWVPEYIGKNQKGMQAGEQLSEAAREVAVRDWLELRDQAVITARLMADRGVHKSIPNRLIEPWMHITTIISATEVDNFFGLRDHEAAEPHFQMLARVMRQARDASTPEKLDAGEWHLPLIQTEDRWAAFTFVTGREVPPSLARLPSIKIGQPEESRYYELWKDLDSTAVHFAVIEVLKKVSVGRCARVSYLTHDGRRDLREDIALHDRLVVQRPLHASPAEHVAQALDWPRWYKEDYGDYVAMGVNGLQTWAVESANTEIDPETGYGPNQDLIAARAVLFELRSGNFLGFRQHRKTFKDENIGGRCP